MCKATIWLSSRRHLQAVEDEFDRAIHVPLFLVFEVQPQGDTALLAEYEPAVLGARIIVIAHIRKDLVPYGRARGSPAMGFLVGNAGPAGFEYHGHADTLEDAKAAVERNWQAWLRAARSSEIM